MTLKILPPIIEIKINSNIDVMRAGDAARRVAGLLAFAPIYQGIISGVAMSLADWLCRTQKVHIIEIYGIQHDQMQGLQLSCHLDWLQNVSATSIEEAMRVKLADLVDEVILQTPQHNLCLTVWLTEDRQTALRVKEVT